MIPHYQDTVVALSTAPGLGAIAVLRISGKDSIGMLEQVFSKSLLDKESHTAHFGRIKDGERVLDEVVAVIFKGPNSYTGEDTVEISCHGSTYIQEQLLELFIRRGARMAKPGEFSMRAFLNGKMDLSQAEAVNDLIEAQGDAAHELALNQMRGGFGKEISALRDELIHFASLIELELDFAEEDVVFANRTDLSDLVNALQVKLKRLVESFATGNVIRNGVPVAIIGRPNAGKSTLLNAFLNEERAIVSSIAGTTRDTIEDVISISGIQFRFIDTAGIRDTEDEIEAIGVKRSLEKASEARIIIYLYDYQNTSSSEVEFDLNLLRENSQSEILVVANKIDADTKIEKSPDKLYISAKEKLGIEDLQNALSKSILDNNALGSGNTIVSNARHYEALNGALKSLDEVLTGISSDISGDFLAIDIRRALHFLGEITGEITTDDLLGNIFGKFCIGK